MLCQFTKVVNTCLDLDREALDRLVFQRFVGDLIRRQQAGVSAKRRGSVPGMELRAL
jgi:hypothetical protein